MLKGSVIGVAEVLGVAVSSMLVVFSVLLALFVLVKIFPLVFRQKAPAAASAAPAEDQNELLAVLAAAIQAYEEEQIHPIIRNCGDAMEDVADLIADNPMARSCRSR